MREWAQVISNVKKGRQRWIKHSEVWHHNGVPKKDKQGKRPSDVDLWEYSLASESARHVGGLTALPTKEQISLLMSAMGRKGGKIGGKRRLTTMTKSARRKIAVKAAKSRWAGKQKLRRA